MKFWICFTSSLLLAAVLLSLVPVSGEGHIYDDVLRLRVIAESDGETDQARKLRVRDAVLACLTARLEDCRTEEEAEAAVLDAEDDILRAARQAVLESGGSCPVRLTLCRERYPRRDYGSAVLPAGTYRSLRITLGEGEGHNWWCVLFPGFCVRYASVPEDDALPVGLTPEEYRLITGWERRDVKIRFRILELLAECLRRPEAGPEA